MEQNNEKWNEKKEEKNHELQPLYQVGMVTGIAS